MKVFRLNPGRTFVLSLATGDDLLRSVREFAEQESLEAASVTFIGSIVRADIAWYDQEAGEYHNTLLDERMEVFTGMGSISLYEGRPFVHLHAGFSDRDGMTRGGHINFGTEVYAMEVTIQELEGEPLVFWGQIDAGESPHEGPGE